MLEEITYPCKIDGSMQPAFVRRAVGKGPRPLVVALHTWSYTYQGPIDEYLQCSEFYDWNMIFPDFRGPNWNPEGCGSEMVVSDLEDAVAYMKATCDVDANRVYLTGGSGGGHCTLYMAGRRPDLWTAVSAWCPISDIAAWHRQCLDSPHHGYAEHIEKACLGNPQSDANAALQARMRSPLTWLQNALELPVDINTGVHDGHSGSVPVSHAIEAFNVLAEASDRLSQDEINFIVGNEKMPEGLEYPGDDPSYGVEIHFRRQSHNARLTLFEGGHTALVPAAFEWLSRQCKGQKTDWASGKCEFTLESKELTK